MAIDLSDSSKPALMVAVRWFSFRHLALFHAFDAPYRGWVDDRESYDSEFEAIAVEQCRDFVSDVAGAEVVSRFDVVARRGDPVTGSRS